MDNLVRQRAARLQDTRDRNLAVMTANAVNGSPVNGMGGGSTTSSTR